MIHAKPGHVYADLERQMLGTHRYVREVSGTHARVSYCRPTGDPFTERTTKISLSRLQDPKKFRFVMDTGSKS